MKNIFMQKISRVILLGATLISLMFLSRDLFAWSETNQKTLAEANEAYRDGNFKQAISLYEGLVKDRPKSSTLYYNLANSYFRAKKIGPAILSYERSLLYNPWNADARESLTFAKTLLKYSVEDKRNWYIRAGEKALSYFKTSEVLLVVFFAYLLFAASWVFVLFLKRGLPWGWVRKTFLVLFIFSCVLYAAKHVQTRVIRDAIVMEDEVEAHYGPSDADKVAFRIGEGMKVHLIDIREDWSRIVLVNGDGGWVRKNQIAEVLAEN